MLAGKLAGDKERTVWPRGLAKWNGERAAKRMVLVATREVDRVGSMVTLRGGVVSAMRGTQRRRIWEEQLGVCLALEGYCDASRSGHRDLGSPELS